MSENFVRHFVAFIATLTFGLVYWAGYIAGVHGWLYAIVVVGIIYPIVYNIIK